MFRTLMLVVLFCILSLSFSGYDVYKYNNNTTNMPQDFFCIEHPVITIANGALKSRSTPVEGGAGTIFGRRVKTQPVLGLFFEEIHYWVERTYNSLTITSLNQQCKGYNDEKSRKKPIILMLLKIYGSFPTAEGAAALARWLIREPAEWQNSHLGIGETHPFVQQNCASIDEKQTSNWDHFPYRFQFASLKQKHSSSIRAEWWNKPMWKFQTSFAQ